MLCSAQSKTKRCHGGSTPVYKRHRKHECSKLSNHWKFATNTVHVCKYCGVIFHE